MVFERPNVADVNDEGLQDPDAPPPEVLLRRALQRARAEGRHLRGEDFTPVREHLHRVRRAEH